MGAGAPVAEAEDAFVVMWHHDEGVERDASSLFIEIAAQVRGGRIAMRSEGMHAHPMWLMVASISATCIAVPLLAVGR